LLIGAAAAAPGGDAPGAEGAARVLLEADVQPRAIQQLLTTVYGMKRRDAYALLLRLQGKDP
ncbi:MAG: hypothetical protein ACRDGD_00640, partial [Candidatus Limnocylindria bacterium]